MALRFNSNTNEKNLIINQNNILLLVDNRGACYQIWTIPLLPKFKSTCLYPNLDMLDWKNYYYYFFYHFANEIGNGNVYS